METVNFIAALRENNATEEAEHKFILAMDRSQFLFSKDISQKFSDGFADAMELKVLLEDYGIVSDSGNNPEQARIRELNEELRKFMFGLNRMLQDEMAIRP